MVECKVGQRQNGFEGKDYSSDGLHGAANNITYAQDGKTRNKSDKHGHRRIVWAVYVPSYASARSSLNEN